MPGVLDFVRPHLHKIRPYVPGKPIEQVRRELGVTGRIVKLASNENTAGTSPLAKAAVMEQLDKLWLYPEDSVFYLKQALARRHGVPEEWIVVGNGAVEVIYLLGQALLGPGTSAVMGKPAFMIYPIMSQMFDADAIQVAHPEQRNHLPSFLEAMRDDTHIVWVDNPNNPLGSYAPEAEVLQFIEAVAGRSIVVLDEAYQQFVRHPDKCDGIELLKAGHDNLVVLRTFSKIVGLAGARCGYGVMHPDLARILGSLRIKFSVNKLAQAAALASLEDEEHVAKAQKLVWEGADYFYAHFDRLGLDYIRTQSNFIFFDIGRDSKSFCQDLMREGVIVRPGWVFGVPTAARVSISDESDNAFFFEKLQKLLAR